jgi:hypothetical protein
MHILEVGTMESGCYTTGTESLILTLFTAHWQSSKKNYMYMYNFYVHVLLQLFIFCLLLFCTVYRYVLWQIRVILLF